MNTKETLWNRLSDENRKKLFSDEFTNKIVVPTLKNELYVSDLTFDVVIHLNNKLSKTAMINPIEIFEIFE